MQKNDNVYSFFMSAITPKGFVSNLKDLDNPEIYRKCYLVKGGAGSGKSTLIKSAAAILGSDNAPCEFIHCSLDPSSLDGAIFHRSGITFADATAPHIIEPRFPSVFEEVVSLYECFDEKILLNYKSEIIRETEHKKTLLNRIESYVRAAGMLLSSNEEISSRCLNSEKLSNYITRLCMREFKKQSGKKGRAHNRYLSTLTSNGIVVFSDTALKLCNKIYTVNDENGAVSGIIMDAVGRMAVSAGYDIYLCRCPMSSNGRIDHILIPELSLGFLTSNKFHPIEIENAKIIRSARFINKEKQNEYAFRLNFQRKAAKELLKEGAQLVGECLKTHKGIEGLYSIGADNLKRQKIFDKTLSQFL